jgi:hypothetical protein
LRGGDLEVEVEDRWLLGSADPSISMHYRIVLHDLEVALPEGLGPKQTALALPLAFAVEKLGREIPLEFSLELDEEEFRGAASLKAIGLWQAASGALAEATIARSGVEPDKLRRWGKFGAGVLKKALEDEGE